MNNHHKLTNDGELLVICKAPSIASVSVWHDIHEQIDKELENIDWRWHLISQVEFETYQAFGIREIELCQK